MGRIVTLRHRPTGDVLARGKVGWEVTPFEGHWYVSGSALRTEGFQTTGRPGLCPYKFLYVWLDYRGSDGTESRNLGWRYVLPNPLLPFIWFRVAIPGRHPEIVSEVAEHADGVAGEPSPARPSA